jgi:hypothetical protein
MSEDSPNLFVNIAADPLNTTATGQTPDSGFCNPLDIFSHHLSMALGTALPKALTTLSAT